MADKYNASARRLKLWGLLRGRRYPIRIAWLANHFGVSYDTINRDLDLLETAGFPTDRSSAADGGHRLVLPRSGERVDAVFTPHEAQVLAGLGPIVAPFRGMLLHHGFESAVGKIADTLGPKDRALVLGTSQHIYWVADGGVLPYGDSDKSAICDAVCTAVWRSRRLKYSYQSAAGTHYSGTLEPFRLCIYRSTLYVLARPVHAADAVTT